jgi:hypothetical protein
MFHMAYLKHMCRYGTVLHVGILFKRQYKSTRSGSGSADPSPVPVPLNYEFGSFSFSQWLSKLNKTSRLFTTFCFTYRKSINNFIMYLLYPGK